MITLFFLFLLSVKVKASVSRELPYYIKAYLYNTDMENYEDVVQKIYAALEEVIEGVPVKSATLKVSRYFRNCESMIENWLLRWNLLLACSVEYDPTSPQLLTTDIMNKHYSLILRNIQTPTEDEAFLDKWIVRFFWMQEFVDALHAAVLMREDKDTLRMGMFMFRLIIRKVKDCLSEWERTLQKNGNYGLIRPPQESKLVSSHFGYWTFQEFRRMSSSMDDAVPFDLLLKNVQYYRSLNMLDVRLYSYEDMDNHVQISKMLHTSLSHHRHLRFIIPRMEKLSNQVKDRWKRGKRIQLGDDYELVKVMWTPWYGLALPTVYALESMDGFAADSLIDFLNYGLKGTLLTINTMEYKHGLALWDVYLSSLDTIFQTVQPDLVPVIKSVHGKYRKLLELWCQPAIRAGMMKLHGYRPQDLASYSLKSSEWKKRVLREMKELGVQEELHSKIAEFVNSL